MRLPFSPFPSLPFLPLLSSPFPSLPLPLSIFLPALPKILFIWILTAITLDLLEGNHLVPPCSLTIIWILAYMRIDSTAVFLSHNELELFPIAICHQWKVCFKFVMAYQRIRLQNIHVVLFLDVLLTCYKNFQSHFVLMLPKNKRWKSKGQESGRGWS